MRGSDVRVKNLQKGGGYHLDLLVISLLVLICSFFGLPFYVAATVLSVMHVEVCFGILAIKLLPPHSP